MRATFSRFSMGTVLIAVSIAIGLVCNVLIINMSMARPHNHSSTDAVNPQIVSMRVKDANVDEVVIEPQLENNAIRIVDPIVANDRCKIARLEHSQNGNLAAGIVRVSM